MAKQDKKMKLVQDMVIKLLRDTKREGIEELIAYLEKSDFFTAPASTRFHGSHPGGLAEHSLNVYNALIFHYENLKDSDYELPVIPEDSLIIVALMHDICKVNTYHETWKNEKVYHDKGTKSNPGGKFDWEVTPGYKRDPLLAMGHAGKSVFILQQFIKLSVVEAQAIFWHMGAYDISLYMTLNELSQAYEENPLAFLLNQADMTCTYIIENDRYKK